MTTLEKNVEEFIRIFNYIYIETTSIMSAPLNGFSATIVVSLGLSRERETSETRSDLLEKSRTNDQQKQLSI